jgi:hypothetical protein
MKANAIRFNFERGTSEVKFTWGKEGPLRRWPSRFFFAGEYRIPAVCRRWMHKGTNHTKDGESRLPGQVGHGWQHTRHGRQHNNHNHPAPSEFELVGTGTFEDIDL